MTMKFAQTVARFVDRPLLILPRHAMAMWNGLSGRLGTTPGELPECGDLGQVVDARYEAAAEGKRITVTHGGVQASQLIGKPSKGTDGHLNPYMVEDGTAILPVIGELVNRGAWVGANSGVVSYEGIKFQLAMMAQDPNVKNVILDIDSPGGEAIGFEVAAAAVRKLDAIKPTYAVVNGMAASAAYALASGARRIILPATGVAGSIGVVMLHMDMSEAVAAAGVKPTLIFAGAHKVDGNPFEPLPDEVREDLQHEVMGFYDSFVETVAKGRAGISAKEIRNTEARTFIGQGAIDAGLADEIGTFEDVLAVLKSRNARINQKFRSEKMTGRKAKAKIAEPELKLDAEIDGGEEVTSTTVTEPEADEALPIAAEAVSSATKTDGFSLASTLTEILADDRSQGRERFAVKLAIESGMTADKCLALLEDAAPAAVAVPLASRAAATGVGAVDSAPAVDPDTVKTLWAKAVAPVNDRVIGH